MPPRPRALPSALGASFTTAQARASGVTQRRLRASDLEHAFRGVRIVPTIYDSDAGPLAVDRRRRARLTTRAHALARVLPPHAFFAGETAMALLGGPLSEAFDPEGDLIVAVHSPHRPPRRRGVRGIKVRASLTTVIDHDGMRVSSPASTWAAMAGRLSERELVALGDFMVFVPRDDRGRPQPREQLATLDQLFAAVMARGRRNRPRLLSAFARVRVGSASPLETDYRLQAEDAGLPECELDVEVRDDAGHLLGICDVVYRAQRVIVEIEGDHHRTDRIQWDRDIEKYAALVAAGWEIIRLTSRHIRGRTPRGPEMVRLALARRA